MGWGLSIFVLLIAGKANAKGAQAPPTHSELAPSLIGAAVPLTSTFTYQGQLFSAGAAFNGTCQMIFSLFDNPSAGSQIGSPINTSVAVQDGRFTAALDFGSSAFNGDGRWLEIQVDCGSGLVTLAPRQAVTAAPYSFYATSSGALQGNAVAATVPSSGQVLKWNGSVWAPGDVWQPR